MSKLKDWIMDADIERKRKLIEDYMSKCPFIEMHKINEIEQEGATISIAFDDD